MQDQVVLAGHDWFCLEFGYGFFAGLLRLGLPGIFLDVFVADSLWPGQTAASLEITGLDRGHLKERQRPDDVLLDLRTIGRGIELLLVLKREPGSDESGD